MREVRKMYKVVALMGESGCGKDFAASAICVARPNKFHKIIMDTTRPPRERERDGIDYNFLDLETFAGYVLDGTMLEATCFNENWYYGTNINSLISDKINVAALNPLGLERLKENKNIQVVSIRIKTDPAFRLKKSLDREDNPNCHEICRRFLADEEMFKNFKADIEIWNDYSYYSFIGKLVGKINKITW